MTDPYGEEVPAFEPTAPDTDEAAGTWEPDTEACPTPGAKRAADWRGAKQAQAWAVDPRTIGLEQEVRVLRAQRDEAYALCEELRAEVRALQMRGGW